MVGQRISFTHGSGVGVCRARGDGDRYYTGDCISSATQANFAHYPNPENPYKEYDEFGCPFERETYREGTTVVGSFGESFWALRYGGKRLGVDLGLVWTTIQPALSQTPEVPIWIEPGGSWRQLGSHGSSLRSAYRLQPAGLWGLQTWVSFRLSWHRRQSLSAHHRIRPVLTRFSKDRWNDRGLHVEPGRRQRCDRPS